VQRRHLFELEDQPWFPAVVRDLATDYLQFFQTRFRLHRAMTPIVRRLLEETKTRRIVDLCSGGSGPLLSIVRDLADEGCQVRATLTDLYPNEPAFAKIADASNGLITYERQSVDARDVPSRLTGLRTVFNGFHHFTPEDARSILHAAAAARQPIAIFEMSERSRRTLVPVVLTPLIVWVLTPFIRPFRWTRLLFTYPVPLVPLTCLWDGTVSQLRAYTPDELRGLAAGSAAMRWEVGQVPIVNGRGRLTYLTGVPAPAELR
jgi:hypothetical protein